MEFDELLQLIKPILKGFILQKGIEYVVLFLPGPTGQILSVLVTLYQLPVFEEYKETLADHLGRFLRRLCDSIVAKAATLMNKMSAIISSIEGWFSKLIQPAKKMGMKVVVSLKTMATRVFSAGARFATRVLSALRFF